MFLCGRGGDSGANVKQQNKAKEPRFIFLNYLFSFVSNPPFDLVLPPVSIQYILYFETDSPRPT